jgi:hypothetical protein
VKLFVPDWDDRVDPQYDFHLDRFRLDRDPRRHDVYAYELLDQPCDGVLVSRSAIPSGGRKADDIERVGLRATIRLPREMELMGDCGAFTYVGAEEPPYSTLEICRFYETHAMDLGVSVDHIARFVTGKKRARRYELTIDRALEFLDTSRALDVSYTPMGAVQGWDPRSYAAAAEKIAAAGFSILAVGGLVRSSSNEILDIISATRTAVGSAVDLHVLGIARLELLESLMDLGVTSVDSASPIRTAWTSARRNYLLGTTWYTAIRVPFASPRAGLRGERGLKLSSPAENGQLEREAQAVLRTLRDYDRDKVSVDEVMVAVDAYDQRFSRRTASRNEESARSRAYRRTLEARPWRSCPCPLCRELGIEIAIFRGSNRNRRRGFHNLSQLKSALNEKRKPAAGRAGTPIAQAI